MSPLNDASDARVGQYFAALQHHAGQIDVAGIVAVVHRIEVALANDATVFVAGNGGSALTASHFTTDLAKTTLGDRLGGRRMRSVALTDNVGLLTAWANDYSFDDVFAEQVQNLGRRGDVIVLMSCSGTSPNVLKAAKRSRLLGIDVVALTPSATPLAELADVLVSVTGPNVQIMEDVHLAVCHAITLELQRVVAHRP